MTAKRLQKVIILSKSRWLWRTGTPSSGGVRQKLDQFWNGLDLYFSFLETVWRYLFTQKKPPGYCKIWYHMSPNLKVVTIIKGNRIYLPSETLNPTIGFWIDVSFQIIVFVLDLMEKSRTSECATPTDVVKVYMVVVLDTELIYKLKPRV